jgi:hypothetical protein
MHGTLHSEQGEIPERDGQGALHLERRQDRSTVALHDSLNGMIHTTTISPFSQPAALYNYDMLG